MSFVWFSSLVNLLSLAQYWATYVIWLMASTLHHCKYSHLNSCLCFCFFNFCCCCYVLVFVFVFVYGFGASYVRVYHAFIYIIPWQTVIHIRIGLLLNGIKNNRDHIAEQQLKYIHFVCEIVHECICHDTNSPLPPPFSTCNGSYLAGRIDDCVKYQYFCQDQYHEYAQFHPIA